MRKTDIAYLAGLIDGEGCIGVYKYGSKNFFSVCRIGISNKEICYWIKNKFGGSVHRFAVPQGRKPMYRWAASGKLSCQILEKSLLFLKVKRKQAENLIAFQKNLFKPGERGRTSLSNQEIKNRHSFYLKSRKLNERGA